MLPVPEDRHVAFTHQPNRNVEESLHEWHVLCTECRDVCDWLNGDGVEVMRRHRKLILEDQQLRVAVQHPMVALPAHDRREWILLHALHIGGTATA
jgi:hypothetical protein